MAIFSSNFIVDRQNKKPKAALDVHVISTLSVSPYNTLWRGFRHFHVEVYIIVSLYHTLCRCFHLVLEVYIAVSPYHTLCRCFHQVLEAYIIVRPYHTLCRCFHHVLEAYIAVSLYHTLCRCFHRVIVEV